MGSSGNTGRFTVWERSLTSKEACDEFWDSFEKSNPDWQWQARHVSDQRAEIRFAIWQAACEWQKHKDAEICKRQEQEDCEGEYNAYKECAAAILKQGDE